MGGKELRIDRIGETHVNKAGYSLKIVAYRHNRDIDVLVDGQFLVKDAHYANFKSGSIKNPNVPLWDFTDRVGETKLSNEGCTLEIKAFRAYNDIDVLVGGKYLFEHANYNKFKLGSIKNPYYTSVYGVGYIGEGTYKATIGRRNTPEYTTWNNMLKRCYSESFADKWPTYRDCIAKEEWHNFQVFAAWYAANFYTVAGEVMHLDKDILFKGNKIYGPDTCAFVPQTLNHMLLKPDTSRRGKLPLGVHKNTRNYEARLSAVVLGTSYLTLGTFATPELAFAAYKEEKEAYIKKWSTSTNPR